MSSTLSPRTPVDPDIPQVATRGVSRPAAWVMAFGCASSLLGFAWDLQWHGDVGPDTFFTLPHLFIYAGSGIVGLTCLVMSLRILASARSGGARLSLGLVPTGYVVAGFGTAGFLACGLWDQWWHSLYGFDVTIMSPPHIGLLTCIQVGMTGTIVAFASSTYGAGRPDRPSRQGWRAALDPRWLGLAAVTAGSTCYLVFFGEIAALVPVGGANIDPLRIYLAVIFVMGMMSAAAASRGRYAATHVAVGVVLIKFALQGFTIAATDRYADSVGLFIRDETITFGRVSSFAAEMPAWFVVLAAGITIDAALLFGGRRELSGKALVAAAGAAACFILGAAYYLDTPYPVTLIDMVPSIPTLATLAPVGALGALLAWQFGNIARASR